MRIDIVTLFPELFSAFLATSMVGRAVSIGALDAHLWDLRPFGIGKHRNVDDTPCGGGSGMVMRVDCLVDCFEAIDRDGDAPAHRVLLTPQGARLRQPMAVALAARPRVALICGRYEGFDERVRDYVDEELSVGDFVLTGGEVAAMAIVEACVRFLPLVLGNAESTTEESHSPATGGMLEYPQYTRPIEFRDKRVPEVLLGGNHAAIAAFRKAESERRTRARRPDLLVSTTGERSS